MTNAAESAGVRITHDDGIVWATFTRDATRNSLTASDLRVLGEAVAEVRTGEVLVLRGSSGAFTSGGDRSELSPQGSADEQTAALREKAVLVEQIKALDAVSIAAIDGACVGLGVGLAAACTLRAVSERSFVDTAYLRLDLSGDFGAAHQLTSLVGRGTAADWLLRPRRISADQLLERGFGQVLMPSASFEQDVRSFALEILVRSPIARSSILANLRDAEVLTLAKALDAESARHVHAKNFSSE